MTRFNWIQNFPLGGTDPLGDANLRCCCFSVEMSVKTKESGSIGGDAPGTPPRSASVFNTCIIHSMGENTLHYNLAVYTDMLVKLLLALT